MQRVKKESEYDHEIPQLQTTDKTTELHGSFTEHQQPKRLQKQNLSIVTSCLLLREMIAKLERTPSTVIQTRTKHKPPQTMGTIMPEQQSLYLRTDSS